MLELPFVAAFVTALAVENAVLARALGLDKSVIYLNTARQGILYGGIFTWMVTISSLFVTLVNFLLLENAYIIYLRAPLYLLCVGFVYIATYFCARTWLPKAAYRSVRPYLPFATFNSALFSAFYVAAMNFFYQERLVSLLNTVGYALGTGVGYTAALLVIFYARKRLAVSPVPRSFRGLPILLVYLGLLSLAIFGLLGQGMPT